MIVDIAPVVDRPGPARLPDMVPGRSAKVLADWLADTAVSFRDEVSVVAMDGFQGYATAAKTHLPDATRVMDPFHGVKPAREGPVAMRRQR